MPFLDWVNKKQATQASQNVPYHLLRQVAAGLQFINPWVLPQ
ncbi:MAG: hypothetical protein RI998_1509 [Pseudomonadota bacterium]|jgi:hypothetical protein